MLKTDIRIKDSGVKTAVIKSDNIESNLNDALRKGKKLQTFVNNSSLKGESVDSLKALIDLIVQMQKDVNDTFEKHGDALSELSKNMDDMDSNSEITTIESI